MHVPFLDLKAHHDPVRDEIMRAIAEVVEVNAFAGGPFVARFEEAFAAFCETRYCVACANGTDALWLALVAHGIGPGDEVITVPMTFIATAEAISYAGARPVFVDVVPGTVTMDPRALDAALTPRTKAIIPVHLYGQCADLDPILAFARRHNLKVIEDAAQAQGARYRGRRAGATGDAGAFSFYPGKNLGAWGEAGAVTTNDPSIRDRMLMFREHGQRRKYIHDVIGWNSRMDGIQAAVLGVKLRRLDEANARRRRAALRYDQALAGLDGVALPTTADFAEAIHHLYVIRVPDRDALGARLANRGIGTGIHYPVPVHLQEAYAFLGHRRGDFPVSEAHADTCLSLPMYPEIGDAQIDAVATALEAELKARS